MKTSEELEQIIDEIQLQETDVKPNNIKSVAETPIDNDEFDNFIETLGGVVDYFGDAFKLEAFPYFENSDIKGMKKVTDKYLKQFYNDELAKVKSPESNKKAFEALKNWLKVEVFEKKNLLKLHTINNGNINARFLMYKSKYPISRPVDFETEMGDYLENPVD